MRRIAATTFLAKARRTKPTKFAIPALRASTISGQRDVVRLLNGMRKREEYINRRGTLVIPECAGRIEADGYSGTASGDVTLVLKFMEVREEKEND